MIESADDAREAVEACRIFPKGKRSFGPVRASQTFGRDPAVVSEDVSCIVMIESAAGVENAEAIAAVPGIDCIYIGPGDLAITMGLPPGNDPVPGPHADGIEHVLKVATEHSVAVGMPSTTAAGALALAGRGFSLLAVGADTWWITTPPGRRPRRFARRASSTTSHYTCWQVTLPGPPFRRGGGPACPASPISIRSGCTRKEGARR